MTLYLSCGNCKTVRSFSGTPPTCEVCGWVCSTTKMRAFAQILGAFVFFSLIFLGSMLMVRSFVILTQPLIGQPDWHEYKLEFVEPFIFYVGCAMTAAGLTGLWWQRGRLR